MSNDSKSDDKAPEETRYYWVTAGDRPIMTKYVTTLAHIKEYYHNGTTLLEMVAPSKPSANYLKKCIGDKKVWLANELLVVAKYSLYDPQTYERFGLKMSENGHLFTHACKEQNITFLTKLSGSALGYVMMVPKEEDLAILVDQLVKADCIATIVWLKSRKIIN